MTIKQSIINLIMAPSDAFCWTLFAVVMVGNAGLIIFGLIHSSEITFVLLGACFYGWLNGTLIHSLLKFRKSK